MRVTGPGKIRLNGEARALTPGSTLAELLVELGFDPRTVAVERNGEIVPRARYGAVALRPGDTLEIVRFVQGG